MRETRDCAAAPAETTFEKDGGCDHILEILHYLGRLAARAGDKALAHDIEAVRMRTARRRRKRMH